MTGGVVIAAIAVLAIALLSRKSGAEPAPDILVTEAPLNPNTGFVVGSPEDLAHTNAAWNTAATDFRREYQIKLANTFQNAGGLAAAAASACSPGGPVAAVLCGFGGYMAGLFEWFFDVLSGNVRREPPYPPLPVRDMGTPFRPDLGYITEDGGVAVKVPHMVEVDGGPLYPFESLEVRISGDRLTELFPGEGAVEACRRAGMFCWRPYDIETPFARELLAAVPGIAAYEADFMRERPDDFDAYGKRFAWASAQWERFGNLSDVDVAVQIIVAVRRAAYFHERLWHRRVTVTQGDGFTDTSFDAPPPGTPIGEARGFGAWFRFEYSRRNPAALAGWLTGQIMGGKQRGPGDGMAGAPFFYASSVLHIPWPGQAPQNAKLNIALEQRYRAPTTPPTSPDKPSACFGLGYAGAWRIVPNDTPATDFPATADEQREAARRAGVILGARGSFTASSSTRAGAGAAPIRAAQLETQRAALTAAVRGDAPSSDTAQRIAEIDAELGAIDTAQRAAGARVISAALSGQLAGPGPASPEQQIFIAAATGTDAVKTKDPGGRFRFEQWWYRGAVVLDSTRFLPLYDWSHANVRAALVRGELAWHPEKTAPAVREIYYRIAPELRRIDDEWKARGGGQWNFWQERVALAITEGQSFAQFEAERVGIGKQIQTEETAA